MPNKILAPSWGAATLALGLALSATPAYAGFQWLSPNDGSAVQPSATGVYTTAPQSAVTVPAESAPEVISPVIITGEARTVPSDVATSNAAPTPLSQPTTVPLSSARTPSSVHTLVPPAAAPAAAVPAQATKEAPASDLSLATISVAPTEEHAASTGVVKGFASQVPLAFALRQVLPTGYSFSIDPGIDTDTLVSYKGGKPWSETLKSMLTPAGLVEHEQGTVVTIGRGAATLAEKAPSPSPSLSLSSSLPPAPAPALSIQPTKTVGSLNALPTPSEESGLNVSPADGWSAERGETLRKVLTKWCQRSGVELQWLAEYDYPVDASAHFNSSFEDAVRSLLAGFDGARPQPIGELHTNPGAGQMVLVVQSRGNSYSN